MSIRVPHAWLLGLLLAVACSSPEPENVTITATDSGGTGDVTATATATATADSTGGGSEQEFPGDPLTFFIEETTQFAPVPGVAGCNNDDLNNVGSQLQQAMLAAGWTGEYLNNAQGSTYHFNDPFASEGSPFGQEGTFADSRRVTVYASHGNINFLQWGQPGPTPTGAEGVCQLIINDAMRLGSLVGDISGAAIYATSCTAYVHDNKLIETLFVGAQIGQHFGWHNSPHISDPLLASFFDQTGTSIIDGKDTIVPVHNREAFIGIGQSKPGLSRNSPVVYTPGQTAPEVVDRHFNARMRLGIGLENVIPEPQNPDIYNYAWVDHGTSPTCEP
ncbi:hypothetical protein [Paraliomyxa miuraensis]|uniref:hypothetical protein n=1 Tax=Paraliomyxa miuraensis TaxID=376150 RepID=UPI002251C2DE|nr:hypothetical protein [Paraliomyxa miuraensis]MCX4245242.1 hypothetical protein [Paraliomyxa miuraensis]